VEENKRVVSSAIKRRGEGMLTKYQDILETCNDLLSVEGSDPVLRDKCERGHQR